MPTISKVQSLLTPKNENRIKMLCQWIQANGGKSLAWIDLTTQSGFSHKELITLFQAYVKTTPMAFVRKVQSTAQPSDTQQASFTFNPDENTAS